MSVDQPGGAPLRSVALFDSMRGIGGDATLVCCSLCLREGWVASETVREATRDQVDLVCMECGVQ